MPQPIKDKGVFTRRAAMKILAAVTGAVTLASLPGKWETPLVQVGALPAHAQCSIIPGTASILFFNDSGGKVDLELFQGQNLVRSATVDDGESVCWFEIPPGNYGLSVSVRGGPCEGQSGGIWLTLEANRLSEVSYQCEESTGLSISSN